MAFLYDSDSVFTHNSPVYMTSTVSDALVSITPNAFVSSPVVTSINLTYSKPLVGHYESLNWKPEIHERLAKHYYYKTLDKWLMEDITDVLNYFVVRDGKVSMISNLSDYKSTNIDKDTDKTAKLKADYIGEHVLSTRKMKKILTKFVHETEINWIDIPRNEYSLRRAVEHELIKLIRKKIKKTD